MICGECGEEIQPETGEAGLEHNRLRHPAAAGGVLIRTAGRREWKESVFGS